MKPFTLLPLYIFSIIGLPSLSYSMDGPATDSFVREILTLTTQCINAESSCLQSWMCNKTNPLIELQLKILSEYPTEDEKIAPISVLLGPIVPKSQDIFEQIRSMEIVEKKTSYYINKPLLRTFRISMVMHNQLIEQELQSIRQSLESSETARIARAENIHYARELLSISDPRLSCLLPDEQNIIKQLRGQRIIFKIDSLIDSKSPLSWFVEQQRLLEEYLAIQNMYLYINPLLSDQEKNKRYQKELEKTKLAIEKHHLKIKLRRTRHCFLTFPCLITLQKHKKCIEELHKLSPCVKKEETIALISDAEKTWHLKEQRKQEENQKKIIERAAHIKAQPEKKAARGLQATETSKEKLLHEAKKPEPLAVSEIPETTTDLPDQDLQLPSPYEKFITILTAPYRLLNYISDILWFIHG